MDYTLDDVKRMGPSSEKSYTLSDVAAMTAKKTEKPNIRGEGFNKAMNYSGADALGGLVRGAGSIGATLLTPLDAAARAFGVQNDYIGRTDRRIQMDEGLRTLGANPDSLPFKGGKMAAEIAGTFGVGGGLSKLVGAIPGVAAKAPLLIDALRTGGMTLGGTTGSKVADMGIRMAAGSAAGAGSAGLINPADAPTGALIGAMAPPVLQAAGAAGHYLGNKASEKYASELAKFKRTEPVRNTIRESIDAGYVIPPNMVNPSAKNAIIESFSGKQATSQIASVKNQDVTESLVRQALGLTDEVPLTRGALEQIRKVEGGAYGRVAELSDQAAADLEALKQARNDAQGWFKAYNRSASPADLAKAKEFRAVANDLETTLEQHASDAGKSEIIPALRAARKQIAKTYTVDRALNDASGTVNAKVLGRMYEKGSPLSDGLDVAGKFASAYPSITQPATQMGSPAAHNLRAVTSMLMGGGGYAAGGPLGVLAAAAPFVAPAASRSLMFRQGAQQALSRQGAPSMSQLGLLADSLSPELQLFFARSAPAILAPSR